MAQVLEIKPNFDGQENKAPQFAYRYAKEAERFIGRVDEFNATTRELKFTPVNLTANALKSLDLIVTDSTGKEVRTPINVATPAQVVVSLSTLKATDATYYVQMQGYSKLFGKNDVLVGKKLAVTANISTALQLFNLEVSPA